MDTALRRIEPAARPGPPRRGVLGLVQGQMTLPSSHELIDCVRSLGASGDRQAFAVLFRHFAPRVKAYLLRSGCAPAQAEELAQETMISVWRHAASFDARRAAVSTWVFTIARNLQIDQHRRRHGIEETSDDDLVDDRASSGAQPDEATLAGERETRVRAALERLSPEQAAIVRLSFFEDVAHGSIASQLNLPLGTVKSRIRLAMMRLRSLLDDIES